MNLHDWSDSDFLHPLHWKHAHGQRGYRTNQLSGTLRPPKNLGGSQGAPSCRACSEASRLPRNLSPGSAAIFHRTLSPISHTAHTNSRSHSVCSCQLLIVFAPRSITTLYLPPDSDACRQNPHGVRRLDARTPTPSFLPYPPCRHSPPLRPSVRTCDGRDSAADCRTQGVLVA